MNQKIGLTWAGRTAAFLLLATGSGIVAQAQDAPPPATPAPPAAPGGFGGFRNLMGGNMMSMISRQFGTEGPVDPTRNYQMDLLQRVDVRTLIRFGNDQIEKLNKLKTDSQTEMINKVRGIFQNGNQNFQDLTPQERQQQMQDRMKQMQTAMEDFQGELDKRVEAIMRPAQVTRIRQLDLRWRGPLALADPKVAEQVELTKEQKEQLKPLIDDYKQVAGEAIQKAMGGMMQNMRNGGGGFNPRNFADPAQRDQMQNRMKAGFREAYLPLQRDVDKNRTANEAKVLALLTPEQKAKWVELNGPKFTFGAE